MIGSRTLRSAIRRALPAAALSLCLTVGASAQSRVLIAKDDPNLPNRFTINFPPELGGPQTADIRSTSFLLKINEDRAFASIQSYYQLVDPLNLGGFSTGDITVKIGDGKSNGNYRETLPNEGVFVTDQPFDIFYDGDLRIFGIESPFQTEANAEGAVRFDSNSTGTISFDWEGDGELQNPQDPEHPFEFTYQCEVNSNFVEATTCDNIRKVKARGCQNGKVTIVVVGRGDLNGEFVALDVAREPVVIQFNGHKARTRLQGRTGTQLIHLITDEDSCKRPVTVECEGK